MPIPSSPSPEQSPEQSPGPGECLSPSTSASELDYDQLFQPQPAEREGATSSSSAAARQPPPPPQPPLEQGIKVHRSEEADRDRVWSDVFHRFNGDLPSAVLSLDYHQVIDRDFWATVETLNSVEEQRLGLLVCSYTTSSRLIEEARSFLSRAANASRLQGPVTLVITPSKTRRGGKWEFLAWLLEAAPNRVHDLTHVDDSQPIVNEFSARSTAGLRAELCSVNCPLNLPEFLRHHYLL